MAFPHPPTDAEAVRLLCCCCCCCGGGGGGGDGGVMVVLVVTMTTLTAPQAFAIEKSDRKSRNLDVRQGTLVKYVAN